MIKFNTKPEISALDVGCDGGRWSMLLKKRGWKLNCIDTDIKSLEICQKRIPDSVCKLVSSEDIEFPIEDNSVDLIICIEVHPVTISDWFISECRKKLRPGGIVVTTFNNSYSIRSLAYRAIVKIQSTKINYGWYDSKKSYGQFRENILDSDFRIIYERGMCWFPFRRNSNSKLIRPFVILEKRLGLHKFTRYSPFVITVFRK